MRTVALVLRAFALPVGLALALFGCGGGGDHAAEGDHGDDHGGHGGGTHLVLSESYTSSLTDGRARTIELKLYSDGTYARRTRVTGTTDVPVVETGLWTKTDSTYTFQVEQIDGEPLAVEPVIVYARDDNGSLTAKTINGAAPSTAYTLTK